MEVSVLTYAFMSTFWFCIGEYRQWCSGAGTRGNAVPVNILARERRSHKSLSCKGERYSHSVPRNISKLKNCCHQMSDFKAKMHQIRCRLGLRPRPHWGSLQRSPTYSWI